MVATPPTRPRLKPGQAEPITPDVIHLKGYLAPYQIGEFVRHQALYQTAKMVRVRCSDGSEDLFSKLSVYPCPDDSAWAELQRLRAIAQTALDGFRDALKALGTYPKRLEMAGGIEAAPNPLAAFIISAEDPDATCSGYANSPWPWLFFRLYACTRHTRCMVDLVHEGWSGLSNQDRHFPCPDDATAAEAKALFEAAETAVAALRSYLEDTLGTYERAEADGRHAQAQPVEGTLQIETLPATKVQLELPCGHTLYADTATPYSRALSGLPELNSYPLVEHSQRFRDATLDDLAAEQPVWLLTPEGYVWGPCDSEEYCALDNGSVLFRGARWPLSAVFIECSADTADSRNGHGAKVWGDTTSAEDHSSPASFSNNGGTPATQAPLALAPSGRAEDHAALGRLDEARALLASAVEVQQATDVQTRADLIERYLRRVGAGRTACNAAAEVKLRAERRAGELLAETELDRGGRPPEETGSQAEPVYLRLADLGVSKKQSSNWQKLAAIPPEAFEKHLREVKASEAEELTTAGCLRLAASLRPAPPPRPPVEPLAPPLALSDLGIDDLVATLADDGGSQFGRRGTVAALYPKRGTCLLYPSGGGVPWEAHPAELVMIEKARNSLPMESSNSLPMEPGSQTDPETREVQEPLPEQTHEVQADAATVDDQDDDLDIEDIPAGRTWATDQDYDPMVHGDLCRVCGCSEYHACEGGCWWIEPGLCSTCLLPYLEIQRQRIATLEAQPHNAVSDLSDRVTARLSNQVESLQAELVEARESEAAAETLRTLEQGWRLEAQAEATFWYEQYEIQSELFALRSENNDESAVVRRLLTEIQRLRDWIENTDRLPSTSEGRRRVAYRGEDL